MAAFFLFLLVLILIVVFVVLSLVGGILRGILRFLGIGGSSRRRNFSYKNSSEENVHSSAHQSREGAIRMRKFKNTAEDTDYEIIEK
jgi:hypothetical protein